MKLRDVLVVYPCNRSALSYFSPRGSEEVSVALKMIKGLK